MKEAVAEKLDHASLFDTTSFKEPVNEGRRNRVRLAHLLGCAGVFLKGEYFRGTAHLKLLFVPVQKCVG